MKLLVCSAMIGVALFAGAPLAYANEDPNANPPNCSAADLEFARAGVQQATADYLLRHRAGDPACRLPMPMVQIVTWNDWAEATQVEPSQDFGHRDLKVCRRYSQLLKDLRAQ